MIEMVPMCTSKLFGFGKSMRHTLNEANQAGFVCFKPFNYWKYARNSHICVLGGSTHNNSVRPSNEKVVEAFLWAHYSFCRRRRCRGRRRYHHQIVHRHPVSLNNSYFSTLHKHTDTHEKGNRFFFALDFLYCSCARVFTDENNFDE